MIIDARPIWERWRREHRRLQKQLDASRRLLEHFERTDQPRFQRWYFGRFGALLAELRQLYADFLERLQFLHRVRSAIETEGLAGVEAIARESRRRERRQPRESGGSNRRQDFSGGPQAETSGEADPLADQDSRSRPKRDAPATPRLKQLYRALARRLHPDASGDPDPAKRRLWDQVQQAYEAGDVAQLEALLASIHLELGSAGALHSVSGLMELSRQLRHQLRLLRRQVRQLRAHPAWNFSARKDLTDLDRKILRELQAKRDEFRSGVEELDSALEQLARSGRRRRSFDDFPLR